MSRFFSSASGTPLSVEEIVLSILNRDLRSLPDRFDSEALIRYADHHRVLPLVATNLLATDLGDERFRNQLEEQLRNAIAVEAIRQRETADVLEQAAAAGVDPIVLKGTALAYSIYAEPHLRPRDDVDILVRKNRLDEVRRLMARLGYQERPSWAGDLHQSQTMFQKRIVPEVVLSWDVHWLLSNRFTLGSRFEWNELIATSQSLPALTRSARGLSIPWALLHACIHLVGHHEGEERLIWDWDLRLLVRSLSADELGELRLLAREHDVDEMVADALGHAEMAGVMEVPSDLLFESAGRSSQNRRVLRMWSELKSLPGIGLKLRWARQLLFPGRRNLESRYGRRIPLVLLPLFTAHRWISGAAGVLKRRG